MSEPSLLLISLSPIYRDSRVLRQLSVAAEFGHVTTVGYGPRPEGSDEHLQVPDRLKTLPQNLTGIARLGLRRLRSAELAAPAVGWVERALEGRRFDVVIANEARILALAEKVAHGAPIWADMHEWAPEERTHVLSWKLLVAPFMDHLCREYLPNCAAVTTVGDRIGELYQKHYGVNAETMRNSSQWRDLTPSETHDDRIRLVHSGGAVFGRSLDTMIDAIHHLPEHFTLDMYLIPANDGGKYMRMLNERANNSSRVRFLPPVPPMDLPRTLNQYDMGVYWLQPFTTNGRLALPNKFFDYVQGRLSIAVAPTEEMAELTMQYDLGRVSEGFTLEQCVDSLADVTTDQIRTWKQNSHEASLELSFDRDAELARGILTRLLDAA